MTMIIMIEIAFYYLTFYFHYFKLYVYMYVLCGSYGHRCAGVYKGQNCQISPEPGAIDGCELLVMDSGTESGRTSLLPKFPVWNYP